MSEGTQSRAAKRAAELMVTLTCPACGAEYVSSTAAAVLGAFKTHCRLFHPQPEEIEIPAVLVASAETEEEDYESARADQDRFKDF